VKHHNQKIKFSWNIPNKEHYSFDKVFIKFLDMQSTTSCPCLPLDDKAILLIVINPLDDTQDISNDPLYDSTDLELAGIIHKPILLDHLTRSIGNRR
jgi:hypothetical protein